MDKNQPFLSVTDFFGDDAFIAWRLFRTKETDAHWADFVRKNRESENLLQDACQRFDAVRLNEGRFSSETENELYQKIRQRILARKKNRKRISLYFLSAAACLLLIIVSTIIFRTGNNPHDMTIPDEMLAESPRQDDVQLITGNNVISLESNSSITLSGEGGASVTDGSRKNKALQLSDDKNNKLIVPYGKRSFLTLADGTKVWLNSGTELDFPSNFEGDSRNIRITGEIYAEVAKSHKPFFVYTPKAVVRVMGTTFNVSAYEEDESESVVLVEGSVQVSGNGNTSGIVLRPNEMATIFAENITTRKVDVAEHVSWRNGVMQFSDTSMDEVLKKIGRYYNVTFKNDTEMPLNEKTVSGKLFLSHNVDSVMAIISTLSSTDYKRENDLILIRKR